MTKLFQSYDGPGREKAYAVLSHLVAGRWRTWRQAMTDALYGDHGFYLASGTPSRHFRTAAHTGETWASAIAGLAEAVDDALGRPDDFTVVDIGAGGGELLSRLAEIAPERWTLLGVDVADRPADLSQRVRWQRQFPAEIHGLMLAVELLDVVPLDIVELTPDGPRVVEVDEDGLERLGPAADLDHREWLARWWPVRSHGDRAEVGRPRDELWQDVRTRLDSGLAVAVDYAANPAEHVAGTLVGHRDGRHRPPIADGTMDLTAHVLFESLCVEGDLLVNQREALRRLGVTATPPVYDHNPDTYLVELTRASEAAELLNPYDLGSFGWLLHPKKIELPELLR